MLWLWILLLSVAVLTLTASFICFMMVFYSPKRKPLGPDEYEIPEGEIYEVFREDMIAWTKEIRAMPHEDISIRSVDGLTLRGKYFEYSEDAPVELLFHGYKGNAERDLCGGVERCFRLGRSVIIIDQRASGHSDGHVITFGIKESEDCYEWVKYAQGRFGKDKKIVIGGVSMGAATVMMATRFPLPENVVCVLADCGYTSPKEIIKKVVHDMKLPADIVYPFIRLGAFIYGHFDLEKASALEAMQKCTVPVVFVHGDDDAFVPYEMSVKLHEVCSSEKKILITIPGAGHGLAFPVDRDGYVNQLAAVRDEWCLK